MRFWAAVLAAFAIAGAGQVRAAPVDTGHLKAELVAAARSVQPGGTVQVALRQQIDKGWHTYWRNAGDSGEATRIAWSLPAGWTAGAVAWPTPSRQPTGPLMNYGYVGEVLLPVAITAPPGARPGETVSLRAAVDFLVCADICVPEAAQLELSLPVTAGAPEPEPTWAPAIARALSDVPRTAGLAAVFRKEAAGLKLAVTGRPLASADVAGAYFFPFSSTVIDHAGPQAVERGPGGLTLTIVPGYAFRNGPPPALAGVLALRNRAYEIEAREGALPAEAAGLGPPEAQSGAGGVLGVMSAALLALLGGLILNLMPCVFPVLAMKAAALAAHADRAHEARRQGLAFGLGVIAAFLALAIALIGLRAAGSAIGWGFQLQDPPVVAALALLMLAVAMNLSGVFEVGASLQGAGSGLAQGGGAPGAFFTGVLAVVVAAPCTAPFMGPAVGWALTQPPAAALAVFLGLAVGFAAPFVAVAFAPGLLDRLPRPGPWMGAFRQALAFPMYGAAAWLAWVLSLQAGATGLARLFAAALLLAFAAWLAGAAQRRRAAGAAALPAAALAAVLILAAAVIALTTATGGKAQTPSEPYSPERLAALRAEGRPVLVNYTAAWCVSCQVNERVALSTGGVARALERVDGAYLKADWTRRDPRIAAELASYGRAGVPLYLVYGADGGKPAILPAILTEGIVVRALEAAARPAA